MLVKSHKAQLEAMHSSKKSDFERDTWDSVGSGVHELLSSCITRTWSIWSIRVTSSFSSLLALGVWRSSQPMSCEKSDGAASARGDRHSFGVLYGQVQPPPLLFLVLPLLVSVSSPLLFPRLAFLCVFLFRFLWTLYPLDPSPKCTCIMQHTAYIFLGA